MNNILDNFTCMVYSVFKGEGKNDKKCNDKRDDNAIIIRWKFVYCFTDERLFD